MTLSIIQMAIMLSFHCLFIVMLCVVNLNVLMLSVLVPFQKVCPQDHLLQVEEADTVDLWVDPDEDHQRDPEQH
jgi:hypothetical protein